MKDQTKKGEVVQELLARVESMRDRSRKKRNERSVANPVLPGWPETVRSIPNEIVRSGLFCAKNRKKPREWLDGASIACIGAGNCRFTGWELRQIDQLVWLQLIQYSKSVQLGEWFEVSRYRFCKTLGWPVNGPSYRRLQAVLIRLKEAKLWVESARLGEEINIALIVDVDWPAGETGRRLSNVRIRLDEALSILFNGSHFTHLNWKRCLSLGDGLAGWLHGYYSSHKKPFPIRVETIRIGAGLEETTVSDVRKTARRALKRLEQIGFLESSLVKNNLVTVVRSE